MSAYIPDFSQYPHYTDRQEWVEAVRKVTLPSFCFSPTLFEHLTRVGYKFIVSSEFPRLTTRHDDIIRVLSYCLVSIPIPYNTLCSKITDGLDWSMGIEYVKPRGVLKGDFELMLPVKVSDCITFTLIDDMFSVRCGDLDDMHNFFEYQKSLVSQLGTDNIESIVSI